MEEGEKKPDAGTISGIPQKKIVYAVLAVAVVILAVVLIAKFGYNVDLLNPAGGQMSLAQRNLSYKVTTPLVQRVITPIPRLPACPVNQTNCYGACVYLMTDSNNCGTCGFSCSGGVSCNNGRCISNPCDGVLCPAESYCCDGHCVSNTTPNCGR
jgi:Stigma-specific protein, Stig1